MKASSLQAIAQAAGVSVSTVCRALRNNPRISPATTQRIQALAAKVGYQPNPFAASLVRFREGSSAIKATLTCLLGHRDQYPLARHHPAYLEMFSGARKRAQSQGYELEPMWFYNPDLSSDRIQQILQSRNCPGILLLALAEGEVNFDWKPYSCAALTPYFSQNISFHSSGFLLFHAVLKALQDLKQRGYQRIGLATYEQAWEIQNREVSGALYTYQSSLPAKNRIPPFFVPKEAKPAEGDALFLKWFKRYQPDVLATFDWHLEATQILKQIGFLVPENIPLLDLDIRDSQLDLAGLLQPYAKVGEAGVDLIIAQIYRNEKGITASPRRVYYEATWREGSTLPPQRH